LETRARARVSRRGGTSSSASHSGGRRSASEKPGSWSDASQPRGESRVALGGSCHSSGAPGEGYGYGYGWVQGYG